MQIDMLGDHEIQKTHPAYPNCWLRKEKYTLLYFSIKDKLYFIWIEIEKHTFSIFFTVDSSTEREVGGRM